MENIKRLSNNILQGEFTDEEVATYILLKIQYDNLKTDKNSKVRIQTSLSGLYYELAHTLEIPRKLKENLLEGLGGLIAKEVVSLEDSNAKNGKINENTILVLDITNLRIYNDKGERFAQVDISKLEKVHNIDFKNKLGLLRFATILFGTIGQDKTKDSYKCAYFSISSLQTMSKLKSDKTASSMMGVLEDNEVIYIRHSDRAKREANGQIKNLTSVYGYPEDKKIIDDYYFKRAKEQGYDFTKKQMDSSQKGHVTRNYNAYIAGKFDGDVEKLCADVLEYNSQYYNIQYDELKDMSVFDPELVAKVQAEIDKAAQDKKEARQEAKAKAKAKAETPKEEKMEPVPAIEDDDWFDEALETVQPRYGFGTKANNNKKDTENKRKSFGCNMTAKEISPEIAPISTATNGKPKKDWSFLKEQLVAENQRIEELKAKQQWEEENRIPTDEEYYAQEWY